MLITLMNGLIGQTYYAVSGRRPSAGVRILLRIINALFILFLYVLAGIDFVIVYSFIILLSDVDAIAEIFEKKYKRTSTEPPLA